MSGAASVDDLARRLGISRRTIYREVAAGRLQRVKAGRRTVFLTDDVAAWLADCRDRPATTTPRPAAARPTPVPPIDTRAALFRDGLAAMRRLTGKPEGACRALLGRLLKAAGDDCARLVAALREAESLRPADPIAWLTASVGRRRTPQNGFLALAHELAGVSHGR